MKVSFDFDGTLEQAYVQEYAKKLIERGIEVWVVTTRWDENHKHKYPMNATLDDLWEVVDRLGIPKHHVRFTCMEWKATYLKGTSFVWHLDDNDQEFSICKRTEGCTVPMIDVLGNGWEQKCERLIQFRINSTINSEDEP